MTNSMMRSPSWGANKSNSQLFKILLVFDGNQKFYYSIDKSPPLLPILRHFNPVHVAPSYLLNIHFNIIQEYEENKIILYVLFQASG
jgi:hypothetical protein